MRIITANVNGIRAAARKGFFDWLATQNADVVCIQETKAQVAQLQDPLFHPEGYHCYYHEAEKKGYSGVALYCKNEPKKVIIGLGKGFEDADSEGRYIQADFEHISVASLYLHSGSASEERQNIKFDVMSRLMPRLKKLHSQKNEFLICGDWNIVHKEIDIKNFKGNQKNSGCLPEERAWMDELFTKAKFVDAFRVVNQEAEQYTWWSNRGQAWAKNVGWRIDYQVATPGVGQTANAATIYKDERFSDHAPLIIDYNFAL
ncbi:MAG: exodeoxyribonuclease III [Gammaproteobacteria bacterium]|nr:exodeoxyribonuclease III [Gammaproteobacteria bacterium]MDH5731722.1 exodeoxyribonuclease III [Gammaproteobacteria bacterium]